MKIAIFHLDLGIGGAEQLTINSASALKEKGHDVTLFTSHRDPNHCFPEVHPTEGNLPVVVFGEWIPRHAFGRFFIFFSILRMIYVVLRTRQLFGRFDCAINDQVAAVNPLIRLVAPKVLFYCHFPDYLLTNRTSWLKKLYRYPFDKLEEICTGRCNKVMVNSYYTATVFRDAFPSLKDTSLVVLYPPINMTSLLDGLDEKEPLPDNITEPFFLSLNRYERKKNIELALQAFAGISDRKGAQLVIAGGYDARVKENVDYHLELSAKAATLGIGSEVIFLRSIPHKMRTLLLRRARAVLYTPSNEHFGIVPCEAMALGTPVVCDDSGGPRETVMRDTGFRCAGEEGFRNAMEQILQMSKDQLKKMSENGSRRVTDNFSIKAFTKQIDKLVMTS